VCRDARTMYVLPIARRRATSSLWVMRSPQRSRPMWPTGAATCSSRTKQTYDLENRCADESKGLREQAERLQRTDVLRKAVQAEIASHMSAWLRTG
jgi:hypothetical protein